jgi:hypothetical protein
VALNPARFRTSVTAETAPRWYADPLCEGAFAAHAVLAVVVGG